MEDSESNHSQNSLQEKLQLAQLQEDQQKVQLNEAQNEGEVVLSKKQRKKQIKKQKWQKQKLQRRKQQRQKQKQKKKLQKQAQKQQELNLQFNIKAQKQQQNILMRKRKEDYHDKMLEGLKVIVDLQFYDLMTQKQQNSLIKQLSHCHSINRRSQKCFNYILTSANAKRQQIFANRYNADKWGIQMYEQNLTDVFPKQKLVYLTGDAEEDIQNFDPQLIYIIGGIVDHNRMKKITYNYAVQNKIVAKRLPMKYVKLKASVHLAVNHVWEWMLRNYNGAGWDEALKAVLPLRKLESYNEQ